MTHHPSCRPELLPALTAVRGPLAWLVVAFHFGALEPFRTAVGGVYRPPLANGPFAVDCFFALSGFILFHVHASLGQRLDWPAIREFLWFRLVRIYPVHLAMLLLFALSIEGVALLTHVHPNEPIRFTLVAFLQHLFLVHGWGATRLLTWNYPSWSISSEWAAYVIAPVVFFVALRLPRAVLPVAILATLLAIGMLLADGEPSLGLALPRVWLGFLLGTLVCRFRDLNLERLRTLKRVALALCWLAFVALLFTVQGMLAYGGGLLVAAFAGLMLFHGLPDAALPEAASIARRILARILVYLGETSFAVYMGHAFIENAYLTLSRKLGLIQHANGLLLGLVLVVLIQGFAMMLHHGVEEPARRRLRLIRLQPARHRVAAASNPEIGAAERKATA
nr:acyltransferase [uncultured Lichenicoccus sp.]